ncbi:MAG: calcium-binding protein, partial [Candidatus Doudnabacteria bacterium]|nr:calcium-binding protein [Candidatus Doudnabacteria bacterium]
VGTTTTDAFGFYKFSNLAPGNYTVRIVPPANYTLSAKDQGGNEDTDSDFDPITYTTASVTLTAGQNRTDVDAGLKFNQNVPASVGDRVWFDTDADGLQDAGEPGVSDVLVTLYNSAGVAVASTYTDASGFYLFTNVAAGNYTVGVSLPPAMVFTTSAGAVSVANNSDVNPA